PLYRPAHRGCRFTGRTMVRRHAADGPGREFLVWTSGLRICRPGKILAIAACCGPLSLVYTDDPPHHPYHLERDKRKRAADTLPDLLFSHRTILCGRLDVGKDHQPGHCRILALVGCAFVG